MVGSPRNHDVGREISVGFNSRYKGGGIRGWRELGDGPEKGGNIDDRSKAERAPGPPAIAILGVPPRLPTSLYLRSSSRLIQTPLLLNSTERVSSCFRS